MSECTSRERTPEEKMEIIRKFEKCHEVAEQMEQKEYEDQLEESKERLRGNALRRLCKDSARTVRRNSGQIVQSLYKGVLQGDVSCAKLLVSLIERLPPPKPRRQKRNFLLELALSPEWTGPLPSEVDDLGDPEDLRYPSYNFAFNVDTLILRKKRAAPKSGPESD
jgi:hypothetical protein